MSDSVKKTDVEDVLSSIRRLVSDTAAHEQDGAEKPEDAKPETGADAPKPAVPDALVLTSDQRVDGSKPGDHDDPVDDADKPSPLSNLRGAVAGHESSDHNIDWPSIAGADEYYEDDETEDDTPVVDFIRHDALVSRNADKAEPQDEPADEPITADSDVFAFDLPKAEADDDASEETAEASDAAERPVPRAVSWSPQLVANNDLREDAPDWVEAGLADLEKAEGGEAVDESDADEVEEAALETVEPEEAELEDIAADADTDEVDWAADVQEPEIEDAAEDPDAEDEPEFYGIEDAEEVADEPETDWEAEQLADAEPEPETEPEAVADAEPQDEAVMHASDLASDVAASAAEEGAEDDASLADLDADMIDEDALRDLVAEIVREELTGELGEKITRNVRKLVRREIHRAMMTREFE